MSRAPRPQNTGRAAIYTRISRDPDADDPELDRGRQGVQRQEKACRALAAQHGFAVVEPVFEENDTSASTASTKRRPIFEDMMTRAEAGEFDAIIFYSTSRLTRRASEYDRFIALVKTRGTQLISSVSGTVNLATADGRGVARTLAAWDTAEAERTGERVKAAANDRALKGKAHGGRTPFGLDAIRDNPADPKSRIVARVHNPEHAKWVREAARRVLAGETMYGITRDWQAKGRTTANGSPWRPRALKRILTSPATAGLREHDGDLIVATDWKPILKREDWDRLRVILGTDLHEPRPFPTGQTAAKYTLSGLVRCGLCDRRMGSMPANKGGPGSFYCATGNGGCGRVRIAMEPLEKWVIAQVHDYIDSDDFRSALARRPGPDLDAQRDLAAAIERDEAALAKLDDDRADGLLDDVRYRRQVQRLGNRVKESRAKLAELAHVAAQPEPPSADVVRRGWKRHGSGSVADSAWRRSVLGLFVESVTIRPFPKGTTATLTRRRYESDAELAERRATHLAAVLERRVEIRWRVG